MPAHDPNTLYFCVEYRVINPETKTVHFVEWLEVPDEDASRYSNPTVEKRSETRLLVRCHIGDKVRVGADGRPSFRDAHLFNPCEDKLKADGYTVVRI